MFVKVGYVTRGYMIIDAESEVIAASVVNDILTAEDTATGTNTRSVRESEVTFTETNGIKNAPWGK